MDIPNSYLFTAYYDLDGKVIELNQTPEDKSVQDPEKNAFFDVLYQPYFPLDQLFAFRLTAIEGTDVREGSPFTIAVNLRTGEFEIDGKVMRLDHELLDQGVITDRSLLYYRNPAPFQRLETNTKTGEQWGFEGYTLGYLLGWKGLLTITKKTKAGTRTKKISVNKFLSLPGVPIEVTRRLISNENKET